MEKKLSSNTIRILIASMILTGLSFIVSGSKEGLFPATFIEMANYAWKIGVLVSIIAVVFYYRAIASISSD